MPRKTLKSLDAGEVRALSVERREGSFIVSGLDGDGTASVSRSGNPANWSVLTATGRSFEALVSLEDGEIRVTVGHRSFRFALEGRAAAGRTGGKRASGRQEIRAPMPGKVVEVLVVAGEAVKAGQPVLLFEAMKMQNELRSPHDGVVATIAVSAGRAVDAREILYVLEPAN